MVAFKLMDRYLYDLFMKPNGDYIIRCMEDKDFKELQLCCRSIIYRFQYFVPVDIYFYWNRCGFLSSNDINNKSYNCMCPLHYSNGKLWYEKYGQQRLFPWFMSPKRNRNTCPLEKAIGTCYDEDMSLNMFCKHIDTKLRQDGCIDHLALKCYLIGVHGKFAPLSIEMDVDIQQAIRQSILKYYKNTIYQKFNNGSYISNSLEQPLPNIYLPKKFKIDIDQDDISSLSSVDSICSTLSDNSGFTTNSCIECEPNREVRIINFKKQCESFLIKNSNELLPVYKRLVQVQNTNSYRETRIISELKTEIPKICSEFYYNYSFKNLVYKYVCRFIESLCKNYIWNLGFMLRKYSIRSNESLNTDIFICPCSNMMNSWHSERITKNTTWLKDTEGLPCDSGILSHDNFLKHLEEMKENDVYHYFLYEYLEKWDFYE